MTKSRDLSFDVVAVNRIFKKTNSADFGANLDGTATLDFEALHNRYGIAIIEDISHRVFDDSRGFFRYFTFDPFVGTHWADQNAAVFVGIFTAALRAGS